MKIKKITTQSRRDFTAVMSCEFCQHEQVLSSGYDDSYYHTEVIPQIKCTNCGHSTISGGGTVEPAQTKYPDGLTL